MAIVTSVKWFSLNITLNYSTKSKIILIKNISYLVDELWVVFSPSEKVFIRLFEEVLHWNYTLLIMMLWNIITIHNFCHIFITHWIIFIIFNPEDHFLSEICYEQSRFERMNVRLVREKSEENDWCSAESGRDFRVRAEVQAAPLLLPGPTFSLLWEMQLVVTCTQWSYIYI